MSITLYHLYLYCYIFLSFFGKVEKGKSSQIPGLRPTCMKKTLGRQTPLARGVPGTLPVSLSSAHGTIGTTNADRLWASFTNLENERYLGICPSVGQN